MPKAASKTIYSWTPPYSPTSFAVKQNSDEEEPRSWTSLLSYLIGRPSNLLFLLPESLIAITPAHLQGTFAPLLPLPPLPVSGSSDAIPTVSSSVNPHYVSLARLLRAEAEESGKKTMFETCRNTGMT